MSAMTKLSPQKLQAVIMGMWFLASAFGQLAAGKLGAAMSNSDTGNTLISKLQSYTEGYYQLAIYSIIAGIFLIAITPLVKKLMQDVK